MPKGELRDGIKIEARNYFPFSISEALLDFEILGEVVEKGVRKYQVLVATSPKKTINEYLSLLDKVGVKAASFIPVTYALLKFAQTLQSKEEERRCFLDIGSHYTELAIFSASCGGGKGANLIFSRKIPVAGRDLTKEMTGVLLSDKGRTELSLDEAERIKREVGIPSKDESKIIDDKISTTQILSMLTSPLEQLVSEIERCFDYYREETEGKMVGSLELLGGGASLKGLGGLLSDRLGIEVKLGSPLEGVKIASGVLDVSSSWVHRLVLAIGAALSEGNGINLLPPEIKEETKRTFKRATVQATVTAVSLILVFLYIGMGIKLTNFHKRIAAARRELSSLKPQMKEVEVQHLVDQILLNEPYWEDVLKELSNIIPDGTYLTGLSFEGKLIKMRGVVLSEDREELLSEFIMKLEKGIFRNVKLVRTDKIEGKDANEFELNCGVD